MMTCWKTLYDLCTVTKRSDSRRGMHITAKAYLKRGDKIGTRMEKNFRDNGEYILLRGKRNGSYPGILQELETQSVQNIGEEELLNLCQSIPQKYRRNAVFLMNAVTQHELFENLKHSRLCGMSSRAGGGFQIMNTPIILTNSMPCIRSGDIPVLYGDFSQIQIEDGAREDMQQEPHEEVPDGLVCTIGGHMDYRILDKEAVKGLKMI